MTDSTNSTVYPRQKLSSVPYASRIPVKSTSFHWDGKELDLTDSCSDGQILNSLLDRGRVLAIKLVAAVVL